MYDKNSEIKNRLFSAFSPNTQSIFSNRKSQLVDDGLAFKIFLEMLQVEKTIKTQVQQQKVTVTNQAEEKPKYLNGVIMKYDAQGKPYFEEA